VSSSQFKPKNELTYDTVVLIREQLFQFILSSSEKEICLDLSEVKHCDSAGLALLIDAKKLCRKHGKKMVLKSTPAGTQHLAEFCGIQDILI